MCEDVVCLSADVLSVAFCAVASRLRLGASELGLAGRSEYDVIVLP